MRLLIDTDGIQFRVAGAAKPTAFYQIQNQDNYGLRVRVHRDIVP